MHRSARHPTPLRTLIALLTVIVWSMTAVASPAAADGTQLLSDCINDTMQASYPLEDYRDALANIPADLGEYADCAAVITATRDRQLLGSAKPATFAAGKATTTPTAPGTQAGATYSDPTTPAFGTPAPNATTPSGTPQTEPANQSGLSDDGLFAAPVAGPGGGGSSVIGVGDGMPIVPVVIALSVIALTIARGLVMWSRKPEAFAEADPA